ncbi:DNA repair protein XRCC4 isoform X3 [Apteryx mantelli]|uniref:DNA repair protein XRCC4 isoform X3 n=1 Tax=Apteryx mantelli TaxID=2696672 RepID=A0ABM4G5A5_9AVES
MHSSLFRFQNCAWKMEKTLNRIHPISDPEATYFLQVSWEKDLGTGFVIMLSDAQCAWTGTVSEAEISREAADMEMDREKYVEELKNALILGEESAGKYNFAVSRSEENTECHFCYEKNLKDVSFRLGSLKLQKVSRPVEVIKELIGRCLDRLGRLQAENEHLQKENERLFNDCSDMEKRDSIATVQMATEREKEYDGSTDEESENLTQSSLPAAAERRDSMLSSPDVVDAAPTRKRRQRVVKPAGTGAKVAAYEAELPAKEKPDLASQKTSGKHSPDVMSLETLENTCEPEDLFDDI